MSDPGLHPFIKLLSDLLTVAQHSDCSCETCRTLRAAWTLFGVDQAVERPRPNAICPDCWASDAPTVRQMRTGLVSLTTVSDEGRCVLCGLAVA